MIDGAFRLFCPHGTTYHSECDLLVIFALHQMKPGVVCECSQVENFLVSK